MMMAAWALGKLKMLLNPLPQLISATPERQVHGTRELTAPVFYNVSPSSYSLIDLHTRVRFWINFKELF